LAAQTAYVAKSLTSALTDTLDQEVADATG